MSKFSSHLSPLTLTLVKAPQMTLQQYLPTFPCLPLPQRTPNPISLHYLMLSSHLVVCLSLLLFPFTVHCRIVFAMPKDLEMWLYHLSGRVVTIARRSSCTTIATCVDPAANLVIRYMVFVGNVQKSQIASQELRSFFQVFQ